MTLRSTPSELRALIEIEKPGEPVPAMVRERLAMRLGIPIALAPSLPSQGTSGDGLTGSPLGKEASSSLLGWKSALGMRLLHWALPFSLGAAAGIGGKEVLFPHTPQVEVREVERAGYSPAPAQSAHAGESETPSASATTVLSDGGRSLEPSATPASPSAESLPADGLRRERVLIETARSMLARGNAQGALNAIERHAKEFPRGQLSQMREALMVQALVRAGRASEASQRASAFRKAYPNSLYSTVVDEAAPPRAGGAGGPTSPK